jgi:hypothetical protein
MDFAAFGAALWVGLGSCEPPRNDSGDSIPHHPLDIPPRTR